MIVLPTGYGMADVGGEALERSARLVGFGRDGLDGFEDLGG